jgi:hypothetical protein
MTDWRRIARYAATLPERASRALFAAVGGAVQEGAHLVLPRFVRRSRFYEATARNALRIAVELVGGVPATASHDAQPGDMTAGRVAVKKVAGNVAEIGAVAAFGFSPLWLLAAAADVLGGSRVYLQTLEEELAAAGFLKQESHFASLDQLIGALEGAAGNSARMIDLPPLDLTEMKRSVAELQADAASLPSPAEMAALLRGLQGTAHAEQRSLLEVSTGIGLAFLTSARSVGRNHVIAPYREDWQPLRDEGFAAYAARIAGPYRDAVFGHFDPQRTTFTERLPRYARLAWSRLPRRKTSALPPADRPTFANIDEGREVRGE